MNRQILAGIFLLASFAADLAAQPQPRTVFKQLIKLTDGEIDRISQGEVFTKVMESSDPLGLLVFGAVYINAPISSVAPAFRDVNKLKENKVYLDLQEFGAGGAPVKESDFARLTFDRKDLDEFRTCKAGDCDLQIFDDLPVFQNAIDWKSENRYTQANQWLRHRAFEAMTAYQRGGLKALGSYRDRKTPLDLYQTTKAMVDRAFYLPQDRAHGIYRHVVDYPAGKLAGAEDFFYWEKIDFGQEPTIRLNHVSIFPEGYGAAKTVIANKQLYSSRYMRVALQMYYVVPDTEHPGRPGFFLIEMNDSRLPDFGMIKLAVVRRIATGKSVDATRDTLTMFAGRLHGK
jgi:hypothetical protein